MLHCFLALSFSRHGRVESPSPKRIEKRATFQHWHRDTQNQLGKIKQTKTQNVRKKENETERDKNNNNQGAEHISISTFLLCYYIARAVSSFGKRNKNYSPSQPKTGEYISAENEKSCVRIYVDFTD